MKKWILITLFLSLSLFIGCQEQSKQQAIYNSQINNQVFEIVDIEYREDVIASFVPGAQKVLLEKDLRVYRYWGGECRERGHYYTSKLYTNIGDAKRELALPLNNTAEYMTQYIIPENTVVIYGGIASQVTNDGFGLDAIGGGDQYYVADFSVLEKEITGVLGNENEVISIDGLELIEAR